MSVGIRPQTKQAKRSLLEFVLDQRRKACKVCQLPPAVKEQIREASAKKIRQATVLEWLKVEHGVTLAPGDLVSHNGGRHDG